MFISATNFKKLIKKSWAAEGLTMGATNTEIFLAGGSWVIRVLKTEIPNKIKDAIVELTGELPAAGEVFTCYKKEATQYEVAENEYWNIGEHFETAKVPLNITRVQYVGGKTMRVLQHPETKKCVLINDFFLEVIDYGATEEYEGIPEGPRTMSEHSGLIYWQNEIMTMAVARISVNEDADSELYKFVTHMSDRLLSACY